VCVCVCVCVSEAKFVDIGLNVSLSVWRGVSLWLRNQFVGPSLVAYRYLIARGVFSAGLRRETVGNVVG
jgi:hypothetical protein